MSHQVVLAGNVMPTYRCMGSRLFERLNFLESQRLYEFPVVDVFVGRIRILWYKSSWRFTIFATRFTNFCQGAWRNQGQLLVYNVVGSSKGLVYQFIGIEYAESTERDVARIFLRGFGEEQGM